MNQVEIWTNSDKGRAPTEETPSNPVVEVASSRVQMHLSLPNLDIRTAGKTLLLSRYRRGTHLCLYSRSCKLQSTKPPSATKSSNRTPGDISHRNTPFASVVEVASSRVLKHLLPPNLLIQLQVRPLPSCVGIEEYTFRPYSGSCRLQSTWTPSTTKSNYWTPSESSPRATEEHKFCLYSRSCKLQRANAPSVAKSSDRIQSETLP